MRDAHCSGLVGALFYRIQCPLTPTQAGHCERKSLRKHGSVPPLMLKTDKNPDGTPFSVFDGFRAQLAANRPQFIREVPIP
jgi:hypothetical protein